MTPTGTALRTKREQRGLSARALSARLGKSPSYVSKVEAGEITLSLTGFAEIAKALEMTNIEILFLVSQEGTTAQRETQAS